METSGIAVCAALAACLVMAVEATNPWRRHNIVVDRHVPATMRDGVTLYADVYRPADPGRYPALLMRTPYNKAEAAGALVIGAAKRGYVGAVPVVVAGGAGDADDPHGAGAPVARGAAPHSTGLTCPS